MSLPKTVGFALGRRVGEVLRGVREARQAFRAARAAAAPPAAPAGEAAPLPPHIAAFYANLELPPGASLSEVTRAFKRLLREYHPDRFAADPERQAAATRLVQDLSHAYRELAAFLASR